MIRIDARGLSRRSLSSVRWKRCATLQPGDEMMLILDREPRPLYRVLDRNGYAWVTAHHDDGRFEIVIRGKQRRA